ncbi:MAG: metal ABC transporter permease [Chloroflexota bacterium]|jgi:manganese/iron transport system permease protein
MSALVDPLLAPLAYQFMQRGMVASVIVGVLCAVVGCYVVLKGMAFLGDALAHAILPGVAVAYLVKGDMLVGAMVAAVLAALAIGIFSRHGRVKEDTAIGIVFAAALALGVALMSTAKSYTTDLAHALFGNVLGVGERDLLLIALLAVAVLAVVALLYKEFLLVSFDPVMAATQQLPVGALRNLMLVLLAFTVVISLQSVGIGLVAAMLVTPAATAQLLTRRLPSMMATAAAIGAISAVAGLYLSYYINVASGAAIVLVCTAFFLLAYLFTPGRGVFWSLRRRAATKMKQLTSND